MRVTFRNISKDTPMVFYLENRTFVLEPQCSADVLFQDGKARFTAEAQPVDLLKGYENDEKPKKLRYRILDRMAQKFAEKIPEMALYTAVTYELESDCADATVELDESAYCVFDGEIADFFFMLPVIYCFPQAETAFGTLKTVKARPANRKKFMKLFTKILLFIDWEWFLPNLFIFIPKLILGKFCASDFYITHLISGLYRLSPEERGIKIARKSNHQESKKHHRLIFAIIVIILILCIASLWSNNTTV